MFSLGFYCIAEYIFCKLHNTVPDSNNAITSYKNLNKDVFEKEFLYIFNTDIGTVRHYYYYFLIFSFALLVHLANVT